MYFNILHKKKLVHSYIPFHVFSDIVTASHLPEDKNGIKFFSKNGGLTNKNIDELIVLAQEEVRHWYDLGILPPSSGNAGVLCSEVVSFTTMHCMFVLSTVCSWLMHNLRLFSFCNTIH